MSIEHIDDPDDPRLDDFRSLKGEGQRVAERGLFIAEGKLVVETLIERCPDDVRAVLLAEGRLEVMRATLEGLDPSVPVWLVEQAAMNSLVGFNIHRGVLASGVRSTRPDVSQLLASGPATVVVMEGLTNHDNVGGIFRSSAGLGAGAVIVDSTTADPLYRRAIRVSMGASLHLPWARAPLGDALDALEAGGYTLAALTPGGAEELGAVRSLPDKVALLVGTEGPGLSQAALSRCALRWRIPMHAGVDSLNAATAASIALFQIAAVRGRDAASAES